MIFWRKVTNFMLNVQISCVKKNVYILELKHLKYNLFVSYFIGLCFWCIYSLCACFSYLNTVFTEFQKLLFHAFHFPITFVFFRFILFFVRNSGFFYFEIFLICSNLRFLLLKNRFAYIPKFSDFCFFFVFYFLSMYLLICLYF